MERGLEHRDIGFAAVRRALKGRSPRSPLKIVPSSQFTNISPPFSMWPSEFPSNVNLCAGPNYEAPSVSHHCVCTK